MSNFCGIVQTDGGPVEQSAIRMMVAPLERGGPHGTTFTNSTCVSFAHCALNLSSERDLQRTPVHRVGSGLIGVGDVRLDNHAELLRLLDAEDGSISDLDLGILAYSRWGVDCADRLVGDFAFVVWDPAEQELICFRDPFGVRPFYFTSTPRGFLFASEIKGLLAHPEVPRQLNVERLHQHLTDQRPAHHSTFYRGIERLRAGSWMRISPKGTVQERYWKPELFTELPAASDEEYQEEFLTHMREAVRCRIMGGGVSAHLSGGLDSSAIACLVRDLGIGENGAPLPVFNSICPKSPETDESGYVTAVMNSGGLHLNQVELDDRGLWPDLERHFEHEEEPVYSWGTHIVNRLAEAQARQGCRVSLDGFDGDTVVSHGYHRLTELAGKNQWTEFNKESADLSHRFPDFTRQRLFDEFGRQALASRLANGDWTGFARQFTGARRHFQVRPVRLLLRHVCGPELSARVTGALTTLVRHPLNGDASAKRGALSFFSPDLFPGERRTLAPRANIVSVRQQQCDLLSSSLFSHDLELSHRLFARRGMESRHPFLDRRLVEFCLRLPSSQKLDAGYGRLIMRKALAGVLPDEIRWRTCKTSYAPAFPRTFFTYDRTRVLSMLAEGGFATVLDRRAISKCLAGVQQNGRILIREMGHLWNGLVVGYWLKRNSLAA